MPFDSSDWEALNRVIALARENGILELTIGGITVKTHPQILVDAHLAKQRERIEADAAAAQKAEAAVKPGEKDREARRMGGPPPADTKPRIQINGRDVPEKILHGSGDVNGEASRRMMSLGFTPRDEEGA